MRKISYSNCWNIFTYLILSCYTLLHKSLEFTVIWSYNIFSSLLSREEFLSYLKSYKAGTKVSLMPLKVIFPNSICSKATLNQSKYPQYHPQAKQTTNRPPNSLHEVKLSQSTLYGPKPNYLLTHKQSN